MAPTRADILGWRASPAKFAREVLQVRDRGVLKPLEPWEEQEKLLDLVAKNDFVACRAGQKTSKSNSDGIIALWWPVTRPGGRVLLTAPAHHQIVNILWPEIRLLYLNARYPLGGRLYEDPSKGLVWGDKWGIFAVTTDKPERLQGLSGDRQLIIVDEASGYPEPLFAALFGNLAGGGKALLTGNPTQTSGTFFKAFHESRGHWSTHHISSLSTPNFDPKRPRVPGLATPEWHAWALKEWGGVDSPIYQVRVLGQFPKEGSNQVIGISVLEAALKRWAELVDETSQPALGVDPARQGDDESVVTARRGLKPRMPVAVQGFDTVKLKNLVVAQALAIFRKGHDRFVRVMVDATGGWGTGVIDQIRADEELRKWIKCVEVNSSEKADDEEHFHNMRSQLGFGLSDYLRAGGSCPPDDRLQGELVAPKYDFDSRGRRRIEPKEEIKKRLGRSPDRMDSLALSVYAGEGSTRMFEAAAKTAPRSTYRLGSQRGY